jgi:succinate dehydrogenase/fumarate reductase flavoprotein subunit
LDRRTFIAAAGGTLAAAGAGSIPFSESVAATKGKWDKEVDVVVVGSGAAALSAAVTAASHGASVLVLESAPVAGGATARSGGGYWIPNNRFMREKGWADPREEAVRYMARYSFTELFDPNAPFYGIPENNYHQMEAMFDNAAPAVEHLESLGAMKYRADDSWDYWDYAPENKAPQGRLVWTVPRPDASNQRGGAELIAQMKDWLDKNNVAILFEHRASRLILNSKRQVVGVEATTDEGARTLAFRARKAVHFGSGGFILNKELRLNFQRGPVLGACGPMTNQGDFVYMATEAGAKLGNMQNGWRFQLVLDQALQSPALATDVWGVIGDSMVMVNKFGRRVVDEKRPYADRGEVHFIYDPQYQEWINLVLFQIYDQRIADLSAGFYPFPPKDTSAPHVLKGETLEELESAIAARLAQYGGKVGGFKLDKSFRGNLKDTIKRFNHFADTGVDEDFNRGGFRYDGQWHERFGGKAAVEANDKPNKTLYPLAAKGPYYCIMLCSGSADSNGGPMINAKAQVLSVKNQPIPGLYGAGNCIAAPSGRAYWGGGATIGPALTFGYIAAMNAIKEPVKNVG